LDHNEPFFCNDAEFLGDAAMDFVVGTFLYHYRPRASPGEITIWKQQISRNGIQATIAFYHGFHKVMCYESPSLFKVSTECLGSRFFQHECRCALQG
jgi:dsRNA-specific ribonuclease